MINSNPSPMVYFGRLAVFNDAVRRFARTRRFDQVKAGDPQDCGHRREGGEFDFENECAAGEGSEEWESGHEAAMKEHAEIQERAQYYRGMGIYDKDLPPEYRGILKTPELAGIHTREQKETFIDLANQAVNNEYGSLPTVEELVVMAQIGRSVKGQYAASYGIMSDMFGEPVAKTWAAANAILSPNTPWRVHTLASLKVIEEWVVAGAPVGDSPESLEKINHIVDSVQKEYLKGLGYPEKGFSAKMAVHDSRKKKLVNLLSKHGQEITEEMIAKSGRKAKEFGFAPYDPSRTPTDVWMTTLGVPGPDSIFPEESYHQLGELVRYSLRKHDLNKLPPSVANTVKYIKETRKELMEDPEKSDRKSVV